MSTKGRWLLVEFSTIIEAKNADKVRKTVKSIIT